MSVAVNKHQSRAVLFCLTKVGDHVESTISIISVGIDLRLAIGVNPSFLKMFLSLISSVTDRIIKGIIIKGNKSSGKLVGIR